MIEQVVVNLTLNARAMPRGAQITNLWRLLSRTSSADSDGRPGQFVRLDVSDTGWHRRKGLTHLFEPFYTTKRRARYGQDWQLFLGSSSSTRDGSGNESESIQARFQPVTGSSQAVKNLQPQELPRQTTRRPFAGGDDPH
jgi:hypothetical protein